MSNNKTTWLFLSILILADRLGKYLALNSGFQPFYLFNFFGWEVTINPNLAFGLSLPPLAIIILTSLACLLIFFSFIYFNHRRANLAWPLALILAGSLSNLFDRLTANGVIDYLSIRHLTNFNLADVFIILGCLWLLSDLKNKN